MLYSAILLAPWEQKPNYCSGKLLSFDFKMQLPFLHTTTIDQTALWMLKLSNYQHSSFLVLTAINMMY